MWGCRTHRGYAQLAEADREQLRGTARALADQAALRYADLLAAEAGIAARAVYPTVGRLVFALSTDVFGVSATLVAAYTTDGAQLWHAGTDDEWPDDSLVTDYLAAAAEVRDDYFPSVDDADLNDLADLVEDGGDLYAIDLRPPTTAA